MIRRAVKYCGCLSLSGDLRACADQRKLRAGRDADASAHRRVPPPAGEVDDPRSIIIWLGKRHVNRPTAPHSPASRYHEWRAPGCAPPPCCIDARSHTRRRGWFQFRRAPRASCAPKPPHSRGRRDDCRRIRASGRHTTLASPWRSSPAQPRGPAWLCVIASTSARASASGVIRDAAPWSPLRPVERQRGVHGGSHHRAPRGV